MFGGNNSMTTQARVDGRPIEQTRWRAKYARRLRIIDAGVVLWAVAGAFGVRFGFADIGSGSVRDADYMVLSAFLAVSWWVMLEAWGSRESKILGSGSEEYKRVIGASVWLFGAVAVVSYALKIDTARGFVGLAFPAGALGLLVARWLLRQHISLERKHGKSSSKVLIIGAPHSAAHLVRSLHSAPAAGYLPVAAHLPGATPDEREASALSCL
jgi:FlaA1/EpsC-like NDP-sugar epimerase